MMDSIHLSAIRAYGYVGYFPEEQVLGQWFNVDLTIWIDLAKAGESDRIEDTLDYRFVIEATQQLIQTQRCALIESLASKIAAMVLETDKRVTQVRVELSKPNAPIPNFSGAVKIDITRQK